MFINEDSFCDAFKYLINYHLVPCIEEHLDEFMYHASFQDYKTEETECGVFYYPVFDLTQIGFLIISVMINAIDNDDTIKSMIVSYDIFFPWVNDYMKHKFILCHIYSKKDNRMYIFFMKFQLDFIKITSLLSQYLF